MNGIVLVFHCPVAKGCAAGFFYLLLARKRRVRRSNGETQLDG